MNDIMQKRLIRQGWYATLLDRALRVAPNVETALQAADMAFAQMPTPPEEVEIESVLAPMGDGGGAGSGAVSQPGDFAPEPRPPSPRGTKKTAGKGKGRSRRLARGLRLSKKWRSYKPLELQLSAEDWRQFRGPKGGVGWQNVRTGEVLYQQERPGNGGSQPQQKTKKPNKIEQHVQAIRNVIVDNPEEALRYFQKLPPQEASNVFRKLSPAVRQELDRVAGLPPQQMAPSKTPPKQQAEPPKQAPVPLPADLPTFSKVTADAAAQTKTGGYGDNKVFINHVYRMMTQKYPQLTLDEFKKALLKANAAGLVTLSRADLVQKMNVEDVEESRINYLGAEFNFILSPGNREQTKWDNAAADRVAQRRIEAQRQQQFAQDVPLSAEDWRQFKGPRGGVGWQNVQTGEVLYQTDRPGNGQSGQQQPAQSKPAAGQTAPSGKYVSSPVSSLAEQLPSDEDLRRGSFASFGVESQHQVAIGKVTLAGKYYFFKDGMDEGQEWSEVVASKVGTYMGIAMPMARKSETEFNGNRGIVTNWVNGKTVYEMSDAEKDRLDQKEVDRHVLFSYLMDVDDRHLGNYMVSDGHLVSIDHESFLKYTVYKPTTDAIANNDLYYAKTESDQFDRAIAGELAAKAESAAVFLQKVGADEKRVSWVRKRGQVLKEFSQSNDNSVKSLNNIHKQIFAKELAQ